MLKAQKLRFYILWTKNIWFFFSETSLCGSAPRSTKLKPILFIQNTEVCICRICKLYVRPIHDMFVAPTILVSNIKSEPVDNVFVFAIHKSKGSWQMRSKKSNFICLDQFPTCHISQIRPRNGSPWLATGSNFVMTEPYPFRSFLYTSRTPKLT